MATLTRSRTAPQSVSSSLLTESIPAPFPREQLVQGTDALVPSTQEHLVDLEPELQAGPSHRSEAGIAQEDGATYHGVLNDLMPSIAYVQKSCLMTLNNLLSSPTKWNPIVPDRRHSMPSSPQESSASAMVDVESSSSALQTLVNNLRNRDPTDTMIEFHPATTDSELIHELRTRVESISPTLEPSDAYLATSLISLISHFHRLSVIQTTSEAPLGREANTTEPWDSAPEMETPADLFDTLKRQLSDLQIERLSSQPEILAPGAPPVLAVEAALLWSRIDEELEMVVSMCKERTDLPRFSLDHALPPQYDFDDEYDHQETPPDYELGGAARTSLDDTKSRITHAHQSLISAGGQSTTNEKMRLDLEAVAMAIDRLYLVAPQLHNQRVELKSSKLAQMEKARREGAASMGPASSSRAAMLGKQKEKDVRDLENLFDLLGKASERTYKDQSVVLEGGMQARLEKARLRDMQKREAFVEHLAEHSNAGRFHAQDAVRQPRMKDPEALLTLPEFIREALPHGVVRLEDPKALLTLPEFVKEPPPTHLTEPETSTMSTSATGKTKKSRRDRSLSAPSLSWLRPSSKSLLNTSSLPQTLHSRTRSRGSSSAPGLAFDVHYVAENHESLHHMLVFLTISGATPGVDIEAEVLPPFPEPHSEGGERLIIKSGPQTSLPLSLPARTTVGLKEVRVQSGHYEIKLPTISSPPSTPMHEDTHVPLLDATQLSNALPVTFICASCSLPLVQSSKIDNYRDLPSEHWEELIEAWMCHADQKLHEQVAKRGRAGFWPQPEQALVGGSYILFDDSNMNKNNLHIADRQKDGEDWRLARCLCGAIIGRCQSHSSSDEDEGIAYRLLKYAIRPVSPTTDPIKVPLSAFIVEDMTEFVHAHATYRFIILDEEEERPRILIWLFKPSMRLAYSTPTPYAIPKSASIHAAKVLYNTIVPVDGNSPDLKTLLNKYPGFPQAEFLFYPLSICRRLAGLLKESTNAYPESMQTMTGLSVGWLHRA